ncbi:hypothetical protein ACMG4P_15925 [Pseudovibrio denitrificans]|uniref:hypothetical protein n=1 Tax=Pseudovibrio denitrificans TaxID=258256 RepID=UPI0039BFFF40
MNLQLSDIEWVFSGIGTEIVIGICVFIGVILFGRHWHQRAASAKQIQKIGKHGTGIQVGGDFIVDTDAKNDK